MLFIFADGGGVGEVKKLFILYRNYKWMTLNISD